MIHLIFRYCWQSSGMGIRNYFWWKWSCRMADWKYQFGFGMCSTLFGCCICWSKIHGEST